MVTAQALLLLALSAPGDTILLDFTSRSCQPCRMMEPTLQRLVSAGYPIRRIDVEREPELARRYRVSSVPSFVLIAKGQEVDRVVGAVSYARLVQMFAASRSVTRQQHRRREGNPRHVNQQVRGQSPSGWRSGLSLPDPLGLLRRKDPVESTAPATPPNDPFAIQQSWQTTDHLPERPSDPAARALAATVRIKVDDPDGHSYGTGTIIDVHETEGLVVTCGHIFRDSQGKAGIHVDWFDQGAARTIRGTLISYDLDRDIALVSISTSKPLVSATVGSSDTTFRPGDRVFSIGCDRGHDPSVQRSEITSINKYLGPPNIEVAGQPVDGRSGGGLFTADGALIGICNFADPADNEGIYAALPTIHAELDRIGQRRVYADHQPKTISTPDVTESLVPVVGTGTNQASRRSEDDSLQSDTEVICIVRSKSNPHGKRKLLIVDAPSRQLIDRLERESRSKPPSESSP